MLLIFLIYVVYSRLCNSINLMNIINFKQTMLACFLLFSVHDIILSKKPSRF